MSLIIPSDHSLIFSEYICPECQNEFYVPQEDTTFKCPRLFCNYTGIQSNGDKAIYSKPSKYDPAP